MNAEELKILKRTMDSYAKAVDSELRKNFDWQVKAMASLLGGLVNQGRAIKRLELRVQRLEAKKKTGAK